MNTSRPFDKQPHLAGEFVELRPLRSDDFDSLYAVGCDPMIWELHPARNRYQEPEFRRFFQDAIESGGALVALDAKTQQFIGSSRFHGYDEEASEIEIGWSFLARSHWGGRHNGEMKRLMIRHALQYVESVVLFISPTNFRSQRAAEKIGAVRDGSSLDDDGLERFDYRVWRGSYEP